MFAACPVPISAQYMIVMSILFLMSFGLCVWGFWYNSYKHRDSRMEDHVYGAQAMLAVAAVLFAIGIAATTSWAFTDMRNPPVVNVAEQNSTITIEGTNLKVKP